MGPSERESAKDFIALLVMALFWIAVVLFNSCGAAPSDAKLAELAADTAMQLETNGNLTLNDLRWSEFSGGVGH